MAYRRYKKVTKLLYQTNIPHESWGVPFDFFYQSKKQVMANKQTA
jgi:hypothetical protein